MRRTISSMFIFALCLSAAHSAETFPKRVPARAQGLAPQGPTPATQVLFPALADPLQKEILIQNLKQVQFPAFVHVGGGRSTAASDDPLRDSLALPKSRLVGEAPTPKTEAGPRRAPALKPAPKAAAKRG